MTDKLPELFGRNFFVGYFVPALLGIAAAAGLVELAVGPTRLIDIFEDDFLLAGTTGLLIAWFIGILLMGLNYELIRFLEGYGALNPLQLLGGLQERSWAKLTAELECLEQKPPDTLTAKEHSRESAIRQRIAERFPESPSSVLPTSIGNTIQAFEVYPRVLYGLDPIPLWHHLVAIMSEGARTAIEDAKATFDFWINTLVLASVTTVIALPLFVAADRHDIWYVALGAIGGMIVGAIAYSRAVVAAVLWGDSVTAAFDVHKNDLDERLRVADNGSAEKWRAMGFAITYRDKRWLNVALHDSKSTTLAMTFRVRTNHQSQPDLGLIVSGLRQAYASVKGVTNVKTWLSTDNRLLVLVEFNPELTTPLHIKQDNEVKAQLAIALEAVEFLSSVVWDSL